MSSALRTMNCNGRDWRVQCGQLDGLVDFMLLNQVMIDVQQIPI
jgi:hypothetical protein